MNAVDAKYGTHHNSVLDIAAQIIEKGTRMIRAYSNLTYLENNEDCNEI